MKQDKRCETCINKDQFGKEFCRVCENGDMYKEKRTPLSIPYNKIADRYAPKTTLPITNVIFAPPATIVFWNDGTKSVVKCENEVYDPEKGLAMAIAKRALGNKGNYYETFKKWVDPYVEKQKEAELPVEEAKDEVKPEETKPETWKVWHLFRGGVVSVWEYKHKCHAVRKANYLNRTGNKGRYVVSQTDPTEIN